MMDDVIWLDQLDELDIIRAAEACGLKDRYLFAGTESSEWESELFYLRSKNYGEYFGFYSGAYFIYDWEWLSKLDKKELLPLRQLKAKDLRAYRRFS